MYRLSLKGWAHEFIPAIETPPSSRQKLMIVLHGRGDSLRPFREIHHELGVYNMNYLLLNAPRRYLTGYSWYGFPPRQGPGILRSRAKIFGLLQSLEEQGWRPQDIFFFGFSQGCLMSCDVALHYPKRLGGVVGISGYLHFFPRWQSRLSGASFRTPMLITHGYRDQDLPLSKTEQQVKKLKQQGLKVAWKKFDKGHEIDDEEEVQVIRQWLMKRIRH